MSQPPPRVLRGATLAALFTATTLLVSAAAAGVAARSAGVAAGVVVAVVLAVVAAAAAAALTNRSIKAFRDSVRLSMGNDVEFTCPRTRVAEFHHIARRAAEFWAEYASSTRSTEKLTALHLRSAATADQLATETARRLHDGVLQAVIATRFQLESGDAAESVRWLQEAEAELRAVAFGLSPSIAAGGLAGAISELCERRSSDSTKVRFVYTSADTCAAASSAVTSAVLRAATEFVTNAQRWADAQNVEVHLHSGDGWVGLTVSDDGRGFDPGAATDGFGLFATRAEVEALGGSMELRSSAGDGTTIEVRLPGAAVTQQPAEPEAGVEAPECGPADTGGRCEELNA